MLTMMRLLHDYALDFIHSLNLHDMVNGEQHNVHAHW